MILLDTDVMIDILRRHSSALAWLDSLNTEAIGIPGLVATELIQGCRSKSEQRPLEKFLRPYVLYWPDRADCARAFEDFVSLYLSRGLGLMDALIAEIAVGAGADLATFNTKHYSAVRALRTIQPYERA